MAKQWLVWHPPAGTYFAATNDTHKNVFLVDEAAEFGITRYSAASAGSLVLTERLGKTMEALVAMPFLTEIPVLDLTEEELQHIQDVRGRMVITYRKAHNVPNSEKINSSLAGKDYRHHKQESDYLVPIKIQAHDNHRSAEIFINNAVEQPLLGSIPLDKRVRFTAEFLGSLTGVSASKIHKLCASGTIQSYRVGHRRYFSAEQVLRAESVITASEPRRSS